ncbi:hypothetical protein DOTSEDRAFT_140310 [Dothistroma septosporum NZE10]|uniref:Uncharacterized protein n=1 Tax=Dothistroma septosporum (strain NZE10 / CBS 128990) TaxID=675120 RepID=M2WJE6_DOTSN|nr:hypothetical protein DOTSEDRAFT_140310 [Dothistroma septosporum NZE10]
MVHSSKPCWNTFRVQKKGRHRIDIAFRDRIPEVADHEDIPYVRFVVEKTWRWRPPVGLGHPHATTHDIAYDGMPIPKGAHIHLDGYALRHDPSRHPEPDPLHAGAI